MQKLIASLKHGLRFARGAWVMRRLSLRHRDLLRELRPLAVALEQRISPRHQDSGALFNVFSISDDGVTLNNDPEDTAQVAQCPQLIAKLQAMQLERVELDIQLEEGQVIEAFLLLFHAQPHLAQATPRADEYTGWRAKEVAAQMRTDIGFHRFCFLLHAEPAKGLFRVTYSYCELPLSLFVQNYVQNHAQYGDHRVLFRAAPRVGLAAFFLVAIPTLLYVWFPTVAIVLYCALGVMAAFVAAVTVYALGSIQYTREHHDIMMQRYVKQIEKLSRFPEVNPNVVMEISAEGEARYINPTATQFLKVIGAKDGDLAALLSESYRDLVRDSLESPGRAFRDEATAGGRTFNFQYVSFPNENSVIVAGTEITYLKQIEADLRNAHTLSEAQKEQIAEAYRLLDAEFEIIGNIQRSLLPDGLPQVAGLEIATHYEACQRAGGDYYDFFPLRNGNLGILIADVSGHGSPAAVLMAITHTIAHILHEEALEIAPEEVISDVNRSLTRHYQHRGDFVTAIYGIYNPTERHFCYSSAGHNPPIFTKKGSSDSKPLKKQFGIPLGIMEEAQFESTNIPLNEGDTLLLFTDGITEAMDREHNLFGDQRMANAIGNGAPAEAQVATLLKEVRQFVGDEPLNDDRTVVLLRGVG